MKACYVQLILCIGMFASVISVFSIELELSKGTVQKLGEAIRSVEIKHNLQEAHQHMDEFVTPKRAIRYGSFLALMAAIPASSLIAWRVLEKNLLNLNHVNELGMSDRVIHYGSILALLLIMPYEGRFLWDMIQKKFFDSAPAPVEQVQSK